MPPSICEELEEAGHLVRLPINVDALERMICRSSDQSKCCLLDHSRCQRLWSGRWHFPTGGRIRGWLSQTQTPVYALCLEEGEKKRWASSRKGPAWAVLPCTVCAWYFEAQCSPGSCRKSSNEGSRGKFHVVDLEISYKGTLKHERKKKLEKETFSKNYYRRKASCSS